MTKKKNTWFIVSSLIFIISSSVLLINNMTDLFIKYNLTFHINIMSWFGIVISMIWWIILVSNTEMFLKIISESD